MIDRPTARFSGSASAYAANRPGYPPAALAVLLEGLGAPSSLTIADIGAGTGISSRLLAERGVRVYAVEPNAAMRAKAEERSSITWIDGTAENSGLADKSVDAAAAFQAFHWFEPQRAVEEFRRISRRRIALLQYERDERDPFAVTYGELVRHYALDDTETRRMRALRDFAELSGPSCRRAEYPYAQSLSRDQLHGRIASSSYLPHEGAAAKEMERAADELFERFAADGAVSLAMLCYVLLADA